jgi:predicted peroxiredoxin
MKLMAVILAVCSVSVVNTATHGAEQAAQAKPSRILVHVTHGPESPTRAALAFLVAKTAIDQGHTVTLFLAGDAVQLLRDATLDSLAGIGTGKLREHFDAIVKGGGRFYLSGMSSGARGLTEADLKGKPAELAPPTVLLKLALENDRMFTY